MKNNCSNFYSQATKNMLTVTYLAARNASL